MAIGPQAAHPYSVNISGQHRTARPRAPVSLHILERTEHAERSVELFGVDLI
jgi:precorrin-6x reductase